MITILEIRGFLTATVNSPKHKLAKEFVFLVSSMASQSSGVASEFSFSDGVASMKIEGENAIVDVEQAFSSRTGVEVRKLDLVDVMFERNRNAQAKADKMKATKIANAAQKQE